MVMLADRDIKGNLYRRYLCQEIRKSVSCTANWMAILCNFVWFNSANIYLCHWKVVKQFSIVIEQAQII